MLSFITYTSLVLGTKALEWLTPYITAFVYRKTSDEKELEEEIGSINEELQKTSQIHEFARYSRLERKARTRQAKLLELETARKELLRSADIVFIGTLGGLYHILCLWLVLCTFNNPLLEIDPNWLVPLHGFLAYPNEPGVVSPFAWTLILRTVVGVVSPKNKYNFFERCTG